MAFLYGQLDHYFLDLVMHPLIYNKTEEENFGYKLKAHALVEMWLDNYYSKKFNIDHKNFYTVDKIQDKALRDLVDKTYLDVFNVNKAIKKYNKGLLRLLLFDALVRNNELLISDLALSLLNIGDITYDTNVQRLRKYINPENETWRHPETGEFSIESIDDLWDKAALYYLETVNDVNKYIYDGKPLNNYFIGNDISYNTGIPCSEGQHNTYVRRKRAR